MSEQIKIISGRRKSVLRKAFRTVQDELGVGATVAFPDWDDRHPYVEETLQGLYRVGAIGEPYRNVDGYAIAVIEATGAGSSAPIRGRFDSELTGTQVNLGDHAPVTVEGVVDDGGGGEAINAETGEVTPPGEPLSPVLEASYPDDATPLQEPGEPPQEPALSEPPDDLEDKTMNELKDVALTEGIELERGLRKPDVIERIRAARG